MYQILDKACGRTARKMGRINIEKHLYKLTKKLVKYVKKQDEEKQEKIKIIFALLVLLFLNLLLMIFN